MSANNKEALAFMAVLLVFAVAASAYVLNECWGSGKTSHFKLLLRCITIITTVIPPELPIELSMAVTGQCLIWGCGLWFVVCGSWFVVCGLRCGNSVLPIGSTHEVPDASWRVLHAAISAAVRWTSWHLHIRQDWNPDL
jgi:hypothetical protein